MKIEKFATIHITDVCEDGTEVYTNEQFAKALIELLKEGLSENGEVEVISVE